MSLSYGFNHLCHGAGRDFTFYPLFTCNCDAEKLAAWAQLAGLWKKAETWHDGVLPPSGNVFREFPVTTWNLEGISVVRIQRSETVVNFASKNYGPIMVHESVPTAT
jgi:hypothetical protein